MHGVYAIGKGDIPEDMEFFRKPDKDGKAQPLLHICERSDDPTQQHPTDIVVVDTVNWCYAKGFYYCDGCKSVFDEEGDLELVWADGKGTGHEAHA